MKKNKKVPKIDGDDTPTVRIRHNRFDGFDVYTAELNGRKTLFHKEVLPKPFIIGGLFKVLGANGNLWLCENIKTKEIHIGPDQSFENIVAEEKLATTSSASLQEMEQSA